MNKCGECFSLVGERGEAVEWVLGRNCFFVNLKNRKENTMEQYNVKVWVLGQLLSWKRFTPKCDLCVNKWL